MESAGRLHYHGPRAADLRASSCDWVLAAFVALALLRLIGDACPSWCFAREVVHLGRFAWLGRFRRSSGTVAHDGRGAWRT